ncbi:MAG: hypothetical protein PHE83_17520 [Opitutaceae bacterium]|nr:hypothetical protein [Opitutaceae bacterium]
MNNPTETDIKAAADQLMHSERGAQAMKDLLAFFDHGANALDFTNQQAVATILRAVWSSGIPGTARCILRERLGGSGS